MKPCYLSLRPTIQSAPHLYALLQQEQARGGTRLFRALCLLAASVGLALVPGVFLWRIGMAGAVACFAWFVHTAIELSARHWFLHLLTLQDALDDARGRFGGDADPDTYVNRMIKRGTPVSFDEMVAFEVESAQRRAEAAARERAEEIIEAVRTDALARACGFQSDEVH